MTVSRQAHPTRLSGGVTRSPDHFRLPSDQVERIRAVRESSSSRWCGCWDTFSAVGSDALADWRGGRAARLDQLVAAHQRIGGGSAGRRWQTEQLNWALILRLAAEFQGFARELHDLGAQALAAGNSGPMAGVVQRSLVLNRQLDRGNAQPGSLGSDFGRFGLEWWPELTKRDARTTARQEQLELLNRARNAIVHSLPAELEQLEREGHRATLATVRKWRSGLSGLATTMDLVLVAHVASVVGGPAPW